MASLGAGTFCVLMFCMLDFTTSSAISSITRVANLDLPAGERITKREAPDQNKEDEKKDAVHLGLSPALGLQSQDPDNDKQKKPQDNNDDVSHHIYVLKDHQQQASRLRRSANQQSQDDDLDTAANTVFLPQFRRHLRPAYRFRRDLDLVDLEEAAGRSVREVKDADDLDTAANTVFLPQFRRHLRPAFRQF